MKEQLTIGLFGYGNVGQGTYQILQNSKSVPNKVVKICVKTEGKRRNIDLSNFTFDKYELLDNPEINLIVEMIDDAAAAFEIVKEALERGKDVVTANKKMVADNFEELIELQKQHNCSVLYEASACSSIPIIRTLEEYYDNDILQGVSGIFNSSTNYILTKIFNENRDYDIALKQAQDLGYSETNSNLDIIGKDALHKLLIVAAHAFGKVVKPDDVVCHGIQHISRYDIEYARERGYRIKHMGVVQKFDNNKLAMYVLPQFVDEKNRMFDVDLEYNAVLIDANYAGLQYMDGKGAGGFPTGSAVMSDISANAYNYKYEYKKYHRHLDVDFSNELKVEVYLRYYDKKNLELFEFSKIKARFESKEFNYVIGEIKLANILSAHERLNEADILLVNTGRVVKD